MLSHVVGYRVQCTDDHMHLQVNQHKKASQLPAHPQLVPQGSEVTCEQRLNASWLHCAWAAGFKHACVTHLGPSPIGVVHLQMLTDMH